MKKFILALAIAAAAFFYYQSTEIQGAPSVDTEDPISSAHAGPKIDDIVIVEMPADSKTKSPELAKPDYPYGVNQADLDNYWAVMDLAERGNYQAQRNIAYGFVEYPYHNQPKNRVLGCAWYLVVLNSGSSKVNTTDQNNANVYCGRLEPDLLDAAKQNAADLLAKINEKTKFGKLDD